jgi:hypothetical protein
MPDASLMICFTQATGPLKDRPRAPKELQRRLDWPPAENVDYDMTGLELRNVHLRSTDAGTTWNQVSADPFRSPMNPAPFPHSGHPELLATREGVVLHIATSGIDWTDNAGKSWQRLKLPGTAYYPRSLQTADGQIHVFAHVGSDNPYGAVDQSIVMDTFRLTKE